MTVTLDNSFMEKEVIQAPLYLESPKYLFMGYRESKSIMPSNVNSLESYFELVMQNNQKTTEILNETDEDGEVIYYYTYYTMSIEGRDYGYMAFSMEGKNSYYTMNFACLESNFEDSKELFAKWIKTIVVE